MDPHMTENLKILRAGGDAAWLWTCSIFWSFRGGTDGIVPARHVPQLSDRKQPIRLAGVLVREDLWHEPGHGCDRCPQPLPGNYVIHDYPYHQGSVNGARAVREAKGAGGAFGNHQRWHTARGVTDPDCKHCVASIAGGSHMRSDMRSDTDEVCDPSTDSGANRISDRTSESHPEGQDHEPLPFPKEISPRVVRPPTGASRISDRSPGHGKKTRQRYDYGDDQDFHRFWTTFPARHGKPAAYKAWLAAMKRGADPEAVIKAAERYRDDPGRDPNHTKYPQGWLNDERYNDNPAATSRPDDGCWDE